MKNDLISSTEASQILGCHIITFRSWVHKGRLPPPVEIHPRCWRHTRASVERLAAELAREAEQAKGVNRG